MQNILNNDAAKESFLPENRFFGSKTSENRIDSFTTDFLIAAILIKNRLEKISAWSTAKTDVKFENYDSRT